MKFRTEIELPPSEWQLDHSARILSVGSCFAQTMGTRLQENKFPVRINPFGIIYNPLAMVRPLQAALSSSFKESSRTAA